MRKTKKRGGKLKIPTPIKGKGKEREQLARVLKRGKRDLPDFTGSGHCHVLPFGKKCAAPSNQGRADDS